MGKPTEIFRFGNFVARVPDNKESLRRWIIDNCPYKKAEGMIPDTFSVAECTKIARATGYSFNSIVDNSVNLHDLSRLANVLKLADIGTVAREITRHIEMDGNIVCDCRSCDSHGTLVVFPEFQTFRCFSCGRSGDVLSFVMDVLRMDYETALGYLELKFLK